MSSSEVRTARAERRDLSLAQLADFAAEVADFIGNELGLAVERGKSLPCGGGQAVVLPLGGEGFQ